jgi:hypothetical protein
MVKYLLKRDFKDFTALNGLNTQMLTINFFNRLKNNTLSATMTV